MSPQIHRVSWTGLDVMLWSRWSWAVERRRGSKEADGGRNVEDEGEIESAGLVGGGGSWMR